MNRLPWLDIAKAVAMIAVVFSHEFASVTPLLMLCNSFMLPLFFVCSGFCLSPGKYGAAEYLKRKSKTLLLPYFALGSIVSMTDVATKSVGAIVENICQSLFSWQTLWFLPVLFVADVILYLSLSHSKKPMLVNAIVGMAALALGVALRWSDIVLKLDLEVVPIAVFYLSVGYGLKRYIKTKVIPRQGMISIALLICGLALMATTDGNLVLKRNDVLPAWNIVFSTMEALGVMLALAALITPPLFISPRLRSVMRLLEYIGKNTMVIFAFHMPVFGYCQAFLRPLFKSQLYYKPLEFVLIWAICLTLIPLFNRYAPLLIGKKKTRI